MKNAAQKIDRVIRMSDVVQKVDLSRSTIYELISQSKFPKPFKLINGGRAAGWLESTIDGYLASRAEDSK